MNYFQIDAVRTRIDQAFADLERPDFRSILTLGCCEEHEEDFTWYREHSWQEMTQEILTGFLDPFEFSSLHPVAYHYFTPGLLTFTLDSVGKEVGWYSFGGADWLRNLLPGEERTDYFRSNYLPQFGVEQIEAVKCHLQLFQKAILEQRGYPDDDIDCAIDQVWKSDT